MRKAPINTARQATQDANMRSWVMGGNPRAIVQQEIEGQRSFIESDTLPSDLGDAKPMLEAAGVQFLGLVEGDEIFQYVELPKGWEKVPTDHAMWTKLVDDKGRERALIFYKAAFYDRRAFAR